MGRKAPAAAPSAGLRAAKVQCQQEGARNHPLGNQDRSKSGDTASGPGRILGAMVARGVEMKWPKRILYRFGKCQRGGKGFLCQKAAASALYQTCTKREAANFSHLCGVRVVSMFHNDTHVNTMTCSGQMKGPQSGTHRGDFFRLVASLLSSSLAFSLRPEVWGEWGEGSWRRKARSRRDGCWPGLKTSPRGLSLSTLLHFNLLLPRRERERTSTQAGEGRQAGQENSCTGRDPPSRKAKMWSRRHGRWYVCPLPIFWTYYSNSSHVSAGYQNKYFSMPFSWNIHKI